jgi:hypothetical protein
MNKQKDNPATFNIRIEVFTYLYLYNLAFRSSDNMALNDDQYSMNWDKCDRMRYEPGISQVLSRSVIYSTLWVRLKYLKILQGLNFFQMILVYKNSVRNSQETHEAT